MANRYRTESGFMIRHRYMILFLSVMLFLPPLSAIFQLTGTANFCGEWCPRMFFIWRQGISGSEFISGFSRSIFGVGLVSALLLCTFFMGRYWCSHFCPVGGFMELMSRLMPRFLKINFTGIPAPAFRYGYLAVYLLAPAFGIGSLCCSYCNFAAVPRLLAAPFSQADMAYFMRTAGLINLALLLLLGGFAKGGRAYCNFICPVGALDALCNRMGLRWGKRVFVSPAKCNGCGQCLKSCPTWAIDIREIVAIDPLSCIPCRICETVCPRGAIEYGKALSVQTVPFQEVVHEEK